MNRLLTIRMDGSVSDYEYFNAALSSASSIESESHSSSVGHDCDGDLRQYKYGYYSVHDDNDNRSLFHGCSEAEATATATYGYDDDHVHPTLRRLLRLFFIEYYRNPLIFLSLALLSGMLMGTLMGIWISRWSSMANYGRQGDQVQDEPVQEAKEDHEATTPTPPTATAPTTTTTTPTTTPPPTTTTTTTTLPRHIAIVMDGNRRYGRTHHCNGHAKGARQLGHVIEWVLEIPAIQELTLFCFSTENWHRDTAEVDYLFNTLLKDYMEQQLQQMVLDRHIQVRIQSTHWHLIPTNVQTQLRQLQESTAHFQFDSSSSSSLSSSSCNLVLNLCISYGSRQEIVAACQRLVDRHVAEAVQRQRPRQLHIQQQQQQQQQHDCRITEADFVRELCVSSDPDLLIRTAGDQRLSNFLLWQCSYAELCFIDEPWPAVTRERFRRIVLDEYPRRQRRFGK